MGEKMRFSLKKAIRSKLTPYCKFCKCLKTYNILKILTIKNAMSKATYKNLLIFGEFMTIKPFHI